MRRLLERGIKMKTQKETSETSYTQGPWKASLAFRNNEPNIYVVTDGKWGSSSIVETQNEANARLIAAAPELLALLKEARNRMIGSSPSIVSLAKRTDEAIAKASGL